MQSRFKTNSHSAARPHVGTDPVSVRTHQIRAEYIMRAVDKIGMGYRTDTGSVPTCGLAAEWAPATVRRPVR
ncbi:hypothetical protein HMPREF9140_01325 [Prevotella micans F0438]|uniref:Uncharacterized protein n=1 Tax=Prevotella micans F0438 TaxID=883158 RepID=H1Q337_9BACT|nr:hypothetical protein HMPREF9140_01325 [Prevotella micans F0438]